jgi:NitT/TauT family transport system substrate-binding protein
LDRAHEGVGVTLLALAGRAEGERFQGPGLAREGQIRGAAPSPGMSAKNALVATFPRRRGGVEALPDAIALPARWQGLRVAMTKLGVLITTQVLAAAAFAFTSTTPLHAEDLWRHGTLVPKGDAGFIYMAAEGGFAKAEGLDLKMLAFQNDTLMMKALIAGELDSYEGSPISPLIAGSKGADVRILGCTWPKLTYSLFSHDGIGSIAALRGKKVGISAPGSLPDLVARTMLKQAGIAPSEVSFVAAGSDPERVRALMAKTIDAAISTSDFAAQPELKLKTLAVASEALPQFMRQCVITRGERVRSKRPQLVAFIASEMKAYGFALAHRDRAVALTRRIAGLPPGDPVAEASYREVVEQRAASPAIEIDLDKLRWLRDLLAEDGRMAAKFDPAALTDTSIREAALMRVK